MKKTISLWTLAFLILAYTPSVFAADPDGIAVDTAPAATMPADSSAPSGSAKKIHVTPPAAKTPAATPLAQSAPTPPTAPTPPAAPVVAKQPETATADSIQSGSLTLSHARLSSSGDGYDLFLTIKNDGKSDEKILGAGSTLNTGEIVQISKKDGKEQEAPLNTIIPAGKSIEFSKDENWIHIKNLGKEAKAATVFPVTFYFRSSPNTILKVATKGSPDSGSSVMDWFKK